LYGAAPYQFEPQGFAGIKERLDEIAALGASAVWLSPVTAAAEDDFGYAVLDQFSIRADFGGEAGLRSLISHAHSLGLRVLVDFVPNHLSQSHRYYKDAEQSGPRSPYYDWFDRDAAGAVTQYFDWAHLKNLNFDDVEVRNYITAAAAQFIRDYDVDGFRIDASWAVAQRAPEYWPQLRAELKRIDPDIVLIAEASAREAYHVSHGFDAAYDWTDSLGQWAWHDAFTTESEINLERLRLAWTNEGKGYPPDALILRFINNNDTGERFASRFGRETAAVAATLLFTLPGIPLIYNGDELGAEFLPYDEGPPIRWQSNALTDHYRRLATLRHQTSTLHTRNMKLVDIDKPQHVLAFVRPGATSSDDVLVLLNFSGDDQNVQPVGAPARETFAAFRKSRDLLSDQVQRKPFRVPAQSSLILQQVH
jgi:cyclomaltodextrinase / maltogenic alpha-amylase / neopullulanase